MSSIGKLCSLLSVTLLVSACAAAPRTAQSSAPDSARSEAGAPTSLDDAEAQLDRAYRDLGGARGPIGATSAGKTPHTEAAMPHDKAPPPAPPPAVPGTPPKPAQAAPESPAEHAKKADGNHAAPREQQAEEESGSPCRRACLAYASLRRAVDAVCRMAGDPSDKCSNARERQREVEGRVTSCGCAG